MTIKNKEEIRCELCNIQICKYEMDVGDTVYIDIPNLESIGCKSVYICDECAKKIAKELIDR